MNKKKNSGYDLENKRSAFFTLGLLVTGSLTLAAFTYSDPMMKADAGNDVARELIAINYELEPEKPKDVEETFDQHKVDDSQDQSTIDASEPVGVNIKKKVSTSKKKKAGVGIDLGELKGGPVSKKGTIKTISNEKVVPFPDVEASFVGGTTEMIKYIQSTVEYPQESITIGEQGIVWVSFVIEKDGRVSNIELERKVSPALDNEAKRVVKSFPKWLPGEVKMEKVRTKVRLPIKFILD